jgi:hypothetical protein
VDDTNASHFAIAPRALMLATHVGAGAWDARQTVM